MKLTLEFTLPEESDSAEYARDGAAYAATLDDLREWLRRQAKYGDHPADYMRAIEDTRGQLGGFFDDHIGTRRD
jgi:hypothetical protein